MFLEDGDFSSANSYCEKVLDIDPENALAYLGKLMAELKVKNRDELNYQKNDLNKYASFTKAVKFADEGLKAELLIYRNESIYNYGMSYIKYSNENFGKSYDAIKDILNNINTAVNIFTAIPNYKDPKSICDNALELLKEKAFNCACSIREKLLSSHSESEFKQASELFTLSSNDSLTVFPKLSGTTTSGLPNLTPFSIAAAMPSACLFRMFSRSFCATKESICKTRSANSTSFRASICLSSFWSALDTRIYP